MRSAVALRHVPFESLGLLEPLLHAKGFDVEYIDVPVGDLRTSAIPKADFLVVLGGPIGVYESESYPFLDIEVELIARRLQERRPLLGVCLGAQLMAKALGQRVYPGRAKEIGWAPLSLTHAGSTGPLGEIDGLEVLHWHGDTFDLPKEAELLASTAITPHQAYQIGKYALALQFHLEVQAQSLESWYVGHAAELSQWGQRSVVDLRKDTERCAPQLASPAIRVFERMLDEMFP
ncbi:MAG: glutamine amidotransferase [Polyangiaceae bacterium]